MGDFLSTGVSGLLAFQRALDTTSHNIANVGTDGYSRQRAEFVTRPGQATGSGYVGSGVDVSTTTRSYSELLAEQVRTASSSFSNLDTFATQIGRINNLFSDTTTGLTASLQKFTNALQDVANTPSSVASRQVLLSQAQGLAERLKSYDTQLSTYNQQVESQLTGEATDITTLAQGIAVLNGQINAAIARNRQPPNDLLDQRDRLLDQLSTHLDVSTVKQSDGQVNVFAGSGQPLVLGTNASTIVTSPDPYDASRHGIALKITNGAPVDITKNLTGGSLGALLDFRTQVLDPARNALGHISVGLADAVNAQHRAGIDLTGTLGGNLFKVGGVTTSTNSANTGTAALAATRTSTGALTEADYVLQKTATGWSLNRQDTGASVTLAGAGTSVSPFTADGLSIVVSGTAQTGDRFLIRPTQAATAGLGVLITDPARIAAAAPIVASATGTNSGNGQISAGTVVDATNPQLRTTSTITFLSATTYSINGSGPLTYTSGAPITINGAQVAISGAPAAGDTFTIKDNAGGAGDNRNALALVGALGSKTLNGGTASINDTSNKLVGSIGVTTRQAQSGRDAQKVVQQDSVNARDAVSGVNLDEEAANMLRYQQAYQAAAQLIKVASTLFESLLAATSR
jgi:flagellar hook-associated protein 1 FlgK